MHKHAKLRAGTCGCPGLQPALTSSARREVARRQRPIACSSSSSGNDSSSSGAQVSVAVSSSPEQPAAAGNRDAALMARLAKAKAYKQQAAAAAAASSSASEQQPAEALSEEQQAALRQQFLATLQQAQAQTASQASDYNRLLQQQQEAAAAAGAQSPLDKLAEADPTPGVRPPPARPDFYTNPEVPAVSELFSSAPKKLGTGSADEAADWLKGVLAAQQGQQQLDPTLRPEEFTAAKEAVAKGRGAEIITAFPADFEQQPAAAEPGAAAAEPSAAAATEADGSAAAASPDSEQASEYKPKVTTWGVFPRPQNISQAYGGGRDIRPGQDLETPQQKAAREAEYAAALQRFKKATFTDSLSDAELAAARSTFDEGMLLFKRGAIPEALTRFDQVREKVPLKSRLGGLSTLQAAVCYDTLGNGRQAEALYKRIRGHPTAEVSRKAKQLAFGFQAMAFLKTADLDYSALSRKKEEYAKYFRSAADRNRLYVPSEEELAADKEEAERAAAVALGVVLGPVLIMGALLVSLKM